MTNSGKRKREPTWGDVKTRLGDIEHGGLVRLIADLYAASSDNRAFLYARFALGGDPLGYAGKEMTFTSYVHVGEPEFNKHKFGLLYVSEHEGRLFHQKYLFQAIYRTADGRWAGCEDSNTWLPPQSARHVKPEMVAFWPPVLFDTRKMTMAERTGRAQSS